ncbi:hypothetical protein TorRG33x02_051160, partial [Trema orientale]
MCSYVMDFNLHRPSDYGLVNVNIPTNGAEISGAFCGKRQLVVVLVDKRQI